MKTRSAREERNSGARPRRKKIKIERRCSEMKMLSIEEELRNNSYPGRGIIIGKTRREESCHSVFYHGTQ